MHRYIAVLFLIALFSGCNPLREITEKAPVIPVEMPADPVQSMQIWKNYITYRQEKQLAVSSSEYAAAADYARKAGETALSAEWAEQAVETGFEEPWIFLMLADEYRNRDNLTRELNNLEKFAVKFPELAVDSGVNDRLFEIYLEIDRTRAFRLWNDITEKSRSNEQYLEAYFRYASQAGDELLTDSVAGKLLNVNPANISALEWFAVKHYKIAEESYQREMDKYERNKTHVQYQFLLNALKPITEEFRQSLNYFETLWDITPEVRYAAYMANIYTLFNNREKADYFRKIAQQK